MDFGLHKVIDDRIKKTIKRVASEVVIGSSLGLNLRQNSGGVEGEEEEDELEAALAQQRREKEESGGGGGGGAEGTGAEAGGGGGRGGVAGVLSPLDGPRSPLRMQPRRNMSRLALASPAMAVTPEEDELEMAAATGSGTATTGGTGTPSAAGGAAVGGAGRGAMPLGGAAAGSKSPLATVSSGPASATSFLDGRPTGDDATVMGSAGSSQGLPTGASPMVRGGKGWGGGGRAGGEGRGRGDSPNSPRQHSG